MLHVLKIYPVELAAEMETGSRLPTDEYIPPDTTQLDSSVASASAVCIGHSSPEANAAK